MSSISSSSTYSVSASSNKGMSGLASGLDTESWVEQMLSGTQGKIDKQEGLKQQLTWKQEMYRDVITSINSFHSKYFDKTYGSDLSTNLASKDFFNSMISKVSSGSEYLDILSSSSSASVGDMDVFVKELASAAKLANTSNHLSTNQISGSLDVEKLASNFQYKYVTFEVDNGGTPKNVSIDLSGIDSNNELISRLNENLSSYGVTAKMDNGRVSIASSKTIAVKDGSESGLNMLGFSKGATSSSVDGITSSEVLNASTNPNLSTGASFDMTFNGITKKVYVEPKAIFDSNGVLQNPIVSADIDDATKAINNPTAVNDSLKIIQKALSEGIAKAFGGSVDANNNLTGGYIDLTFDPSSFDATDLTKNKALSFTLSLPSAAGGQTTDQFSVTQLGASAIGIKPGTSSRISTSTKLRDLAGVMGDSFKFTINNKEFSFSGDDSLGTMINKINSSGIGVQMTYSALSDTFTLEASSTGSKYNIEIQQDRGNVLSAIFGTTTVAAGGEASSKYLTTKSITGNGTAPNRSETMGTTVTFKINVNGQDYSFTTPQKRNAKNELVPYTAQEAINYVNEQLKKEFGETTAAGGTTVQNIEIDANGDLQVRDDSLVRFAQTNVSLSDTDAVKSANQSDLAFFLGFNQTAKSNVATSTTTIGDLSDKSQQALAQAGFTNLTDTLDSIHNGDFEYENGRVIAKTNAAANLINNNDDLRALFGLDPLSTPPSASDEMLAFGNGSMPSTAVTAGRDALVSINGTDITRSSNNFTIEGITMNLKKAMTISTGDLGVTSTTLISTLPQNMKDALTALGITDTPTPSLTMEDINRFTGSTGISFHDGRLIADKTAYTAINGNTDLTSLFGGSTEVTKLNTLAADPAEIKTSRDVDKIVDTFKSFAEDYNAMLEKLNGYTNTKATYRKYDPLTAAQKKEMTEKEIELWEEKAKEGLLRNDTNIDPFLSQMRLALFTKPESSNFALYDIGFDTGEWATRGQLTFKESDLRNALSNDPESIINLFTDSETGLATQLIQIMDSAAKLSSGSPGTLVAEAGAKGLASMEDNNNISRRLQDIEDKLKDLKKKYEVERQRYWNQFNSMESVLSNYNSQSSWLAQQFSM